MQCTGSLYFSDSLFRVTIPGLLIKLNIILYLYKDIDVNYGSFRAKSTQKYNDPFRFSSNLAHM